MSLVIRLIVTVVLVLLSTSSWAQLSYFTLIDSDSDTATGCAVTLPTSGTVTGIERRLTAIVSETATPQVTQLTLESCASGSFGAPVPLPGTPYPVGSNNGVGGTDVVEQALSANAIAAPGATIRLYFAAQGPTSSDLLGSANDPPILLNVQPSGGPVDIPFLSGWGFLVLALLLLVAVIRQRSRFPASVVGVLLVGALVGIAWAAGFRLDGQVNDWQGVPAVGSDARGDSAPNTDIVTAFAAQEGGNLFFRSDIANAETPPSSNQPPSFTSTPVTTANVASPYSYAIATSDPDGDALTLTAPTLPAWLTFTSGSNGAGTLSGIPGPADLGPHAVVLRVTDNSTPSLSADQAFTITVGAATNPAPVLDLNGPAAGIDFAATFTEGGGAVAIVDPSNLTVIDPDSLNLASATITLTNLLDTGQETLAVSAATVAPNTPITAAYNAATGLLTLIGSAPLAQYQAALRTVTYSNAAAAPTATPARAITFVVSDGSNTSAVATATVTLTSVNDQPNFTASNPPVVNEDAGLQTVNGWATFDPGAPDESGQTVLAYLVSNVSNAALFTTPPTVDTSGNLSYTPAPNAFGTSTFEVRVQDNGGTANGGVDTSAPQTFTITVNGINDQPSFTASNPPAVNENAGAQTVAGWATFNPGNAQESAQAVLAYTVSNVSNPALFSAQPSVAANGNLTYTPAAGANGTSTFEVRVQDSGGTANGGVDTSPAQTFSITVNAMDDPPIAVNDTATLAEDALATAINVLANDTDPDGGPKLIGAVQNPSTNGGTVLITGGGTGLTYQPAADYCNTPPGAPLDTFTYTLTPGGSTATVTVTVNCVNDLPVVDLNGPAAGIDFAATFTEGGGAVAIVDNANLTVSDVDSANLASASVTLTNLLDAGQETLAVAATTVSPNTPIVATYNTGTPGQGVLTLTGSATLAQYQAALHTLTYNNGSTNPNPTNRGITFVVNDGADPSAPATAAVTINAVNSAPVFIKGPDQTVNEDVGAQTVNGWATGINDGDNGSQALIFNITGNTNPTLFSAGPSINATTGTLTYTPAANANGSATITLTLSDNGGTANGGVDTSAPQTFTITVTAVNDAPSFTAGPNQTVNEDAGAQTVSSWATAISAGLADEAGQTLTFNVTNNNNALFSAQPAVSATGVLTYTPAPNAFGTATITVTLSDNGSNTPPNVNTSAPQTFTITVNGVNDAPSFAAGPNQTVNEDAGAQTVNPWATAISAGLNEGGQTLNFLVSNNNNALFSVQPAVSSAGVLTFTPAPNANGAATVTVQLQDSGGTANGGVNTSGTQNFTITVNPVNDPPVAQIKTASAQANMKIVGLSGLLTGVTDADAGVNGCTPTFTVASLTSGTGGTVSNLNAAAGTFDFEPNPGFTGNATASYTVQDNGCPGTATSAPATISITVNGPVIWFVNGAAAAGGNGTLNQPFQTLASVPAVDSANDRVFVFTGTYPNGLTLLSGEQLIGQGATGTTFDAFFGITPPAGTIARPTINGTRPTLQGTVTLNTNSAVRGLNLSTGSATGLNDPDGAITGVTVSEVSSTTTTGTAVNLTNAGGTLSFTSISANGAANGIVLNTTTGSFTVTGTGGAGTGGTIQNSTGPGISLTSASAVSLAFMNIQNGADDGIRGSSVTGLSLNGVQVTSNGNAAGEAGIDLTNLFGTSTWSGITVSGSAEDNVVIRNSSGTLNGLTVTGSTFSNNSAIGNDGFLMEASGTASMTASVTGSTFTAHRGDHFQAAAANSGVLDVVFSGNTLSGGHPTALGQGITINAATGVPGYSGTVDYNIDNNTINGSILSAITTNLGTSASTANMRGTISGNTIGTVGVFQSGSTQASGITVEAHGNGTHTTSVTGNTVINVLERGISVLANDGNGVLNLTVQSNDLDQSVSTNPLSLQSFFLNNGSTTCNIFTPLGACLPDGSGGVVDSHTVRLNFGGAGALANTLTNSAGTTDDFRIRQRFNSRIELPGYTGTAFDTTAVIAYIQGRNTGSAGEPGSATANDSAAVTTDGFFNGTVPTPP